MKKATIVIIICLLAVQSVFAFTSISDPNVFYSFFEKPETIIEFTQLRDGTTLDNTPIGFKPATTYAAQPVCTFLSIGENEDDKDLKPLAVRSNAFSKAWSFMVANPKEPDSFCDAILWSGQSLSLANKNITVVAASGQSQPFALYTNKGFIGILPDDPHETIFILDKCTQVFSFETKFSRTASVLETKGSLLAQLEIENWD